MVSVGMQLVGNVAEIVLSFFKMEKSKMKKFVLYFYFRYTITLYDRNMQPR